MIRRKPILPYILIVLMICSCISCAPSDNRRPGDLLFGGGASGSFHARGYVVDLFGEQVDAHNVIKDTELLLEVAIIVPSIASRSFGTQTGGSVDGKVWMMECGLEGVLHDGSWHRFAFLLDGRKRHLIVGDVTAPFDVGDRLVIVLNDDWEPQIYRDSDLDMVPISEDIVRALRHEWD